MKQQTNIVEYSLIAEEFNWEIKPGRTIRAWGFNQQVPGPLLRAKKGDILVIKAENKLSEPILIHWHGLRVPSDMDGHDEVQKPILPGEKFEYRFEVPDAGTYWYHSHQNETLQMERGMYGGIVIRDEEEELIVDKERVFMIDDMKLSSSNEFIRHGRFGRWKERHDGREGNTCLLNGRKDLRVNVHAGQTERWRFINAASARYFRLSLGGRPFQVIATDGNLLEEPRILTELLITPGERYDILAGPFKEGDEFPIETLPYNRTTFLKTKKYQYATVHVKEPRISNAYIPEKLNNIEWLAPRDAKTERTIRFSVAASLKRGMDFVINDKMHYHDEPVFAGELQVWEIKNTSLMDHPFHLHGFFFQVLEVNGKAPEYKAWKDTFNLTPKSTIKIAWIPDNRPGKWMYHCHILEHHAAGMMGHFEVADPAAGHVHHNVNTGMSFHA